VYLVRRIKKATKYTAANAATGIKVDRKAESEVDPLPEVDYHRQRLSVTVDWLCERARDELGYNGLWLTILLPSRDAIESCAEVNKQSELVMLQNRGAF
jgi:hypothetical protein